jgi:hypothetical protein
MCDLDASSLREQWMCDALRNKTSFNAGFFILREGRMCSAATELFF